MSPETREILVIGATGRTGRHVVDGLLARGVRVRALTRHPLTAGLPAGVDVRTGDLFDLEALGAAAEGADAAFLMWPGFDGSEADEVVDVLAGHVERIVYLGAAELQGPDPAPMPGAYSEVERAIEDSAAEWTFLRAGGFAANTLEWVDQIRAGEEVRVPFPEATRPLVDERDLAEAAVLALLDGGHEGRAYALTGSEALTVEGQIERIGEALGRDLRAVRQPREEAEAAYTEMMGSDFARTALDHWATLEARPERVRGDFEAMTGRPPRSFEAWARDNAAKFELRSAAQVAAAYVGAFRSGSSGDALALLAPGIVRRAPLEGPEASEVRGVEAILANAERQNEGVELLGVEIDDPLVGEGEFVMRVRFEERILDTGEPRRVEKISHCFVEGGEIVREDVFFFTSPG